MRIGAECASGSTRTAMVIPTPQGLQVKVGSSVVTFGAQGATVDDGGPPSQLVKTQAGTRSAM
jgi:hypothetical protein